jgi:hypothetical protein
LVAGAGSATPSVVNYFHQEETWRKSASACRELAKFKVKVLCLNEMFFFLKDRLRKKFVLRLSIRFPAALTLMLFFTSCAYAIGDKK